ncbi:MAG: glycosyltransferase family 39 protein [Planctomycetota bacterium]
MPKDSPIFLAIDLGEKIDFQPSNETQAKIVRFSKQSADGEVNLAQFVTQTNADRDLVVVEGEFESQRDLFCHVRPATVQSWFHQPNLFKCRIRDLILQLYMVLHRILTRTGKHDYVREAITLIPAECWRTLQHKIKQDNLNLETVIGSSSDSKAANKLFALIRSYKIACIEHVSFLPEDTVGFKSKDYLRSIRELIRFWWNHIMFSRSLRDMPQKSMSRTRKRFWQVGILSAAAALLFGCLDYPLFEPDEARNAQLALNVLESGNWWSLQLDGDHYWDKPPLQIWAISTSYWLFGVSPLTTRIPTALAAWLTVLVTLTMARKLVGQRAAIWGSLLLIGSLGFGVMSRYVTMDALLTLFTTLTLMLGFRSVLPSCDPISPSRQRRKWRGYSLLAGFACGMGVLAKGPVALIIGLPPVFAAWWLGRKSRPALAVSFWKLHAPIFMLSFSLIALPWFVAMIVSHPGFAEYFFWKHHIIRFTDAFNHSEPWWYYLVGMFIFMFPASYLFPSLVKFLSSQSPQLRRLRTREIGFLAFSVCWILIFFSISDSKLPTYVLPIFPLVCLMLGYMLEVSAFHPILLSQPQTDKKTLLQKLATRMPLEIGGWCVVCLISFFCLCSNFGFENLEFAILLLPILLVAILGSFFRPSAQKSWGVFALGAFVFVSIATHMIVPTISQNRSIHSAAAKLLDSEDYRDAPLVFFGREAYGSSLTLSNRMRRSIPSSSLGDMLAVIAQNPKTVIVASENEIEILRSAVSWRVKIQKLDSGRHLYVAQPNNTVIAQGDRVRKMR